MNLFFTYFIYFIIYSFIGWSIEVVGKLIELKRFVNRGFLIGPICPIYGYGFLFIIFIIGNGTKDILSVFLKTIFICSILEYFTSYFMEKIFKARWWDYSQRKFNINGRICLETMLPFGLLGCLVIYVIHPFVENVVGMLPNNVLIIISYFLLIIYLIDNVLSFNVMNKIKYEIKKQAKDNTEMIHKQIIEWLESNTILYRHIRHAYPKFKIYDRVLERIKHGKSL